MILVIDLCSEKLHHHEFVKPIQDILTKHKIKFRTHHYDQINEKILKGKDKVIICGTSLQDNQFIVDLDKFNWILNKLKDKPILGICAGMQILGLLFGGKLKKKTEIGFYNENFQKKFLGLKGQNQFYHLHKNYVDFNKNWDRFTDSKIPQAVKHKEKEFYGCLFHPEVRQKDLIKTFCLLK